MTFHINNEKGKKDNFLRGSKQEDETEDTDFLTTILMVLTALLSGVVFVFQQCCPDENGKSPKSIQQRKYMLSAIAAAPLTPHTQIGTTLATLPITQSAVMNGTSTFAVTTCIRGGVANAAVAVSTALTGTPMAASATAACSAAAAATTGGAVTGTQIGAAIAVGAVLIGA